MIISSALDRDVADNDRYAGDLGIQIQGGPAITIPNDVLVVPDQYIDSSGAIQENSSAATLLISPNDGPNVNDVPLIGMAFFSGAYLTVDLDNGTWSVWPAKATIDTSLVIIGGTCSESTNTTGQPAGAQDGHSDNTSATTEHNALSTGVKAGLAVGSAAAGISVIGLAVFLALKRRKTRRVKEIASTRSIAGSFSSYDPIMKGHVPLQEMAGSQTVPYELRSEGKPIELAHHSWRNVKRGSRRGHVVELPADRY